MSKIFGWFGDRCQAGAARLIAMSRFFFDVEKWVSGLGDWADIRADRNRAIPLFRRPDKKNTTQARWPS